MDNKLEDLHEEYKKVEIPENLGIIVDAAITKGRTRKKLMNKIKKNLIIRPLAVAACFVAILGVTVNTTKVLANEIYKIPVIGSFAKMITFREYTTETESSKQTVEIPKIVIEDNKDLTEQINNLINSKIKELEEEQKIADAGYKKAFLETGGKEEDFRKIITNITYHKYFFSDKLVSFSIEKTQTLANAFYEHLFYTIDLDSEKQLVISDLLGEDFSNIIRTKVIAQIKVILENDKDAFFFNSESNFDGIEQFDITDKLDFYIDTNKDIVVVFRKYDIAPGYMGAQRFVVGHLD